ncbi:hypothetical protein AXF42_Ash002200 [Apostasia shenzhenica]|uniref:Histone chaperone domain-containing protein n=1 Tax=Apostasia shenzhenica TaxID=1088818 RepID=A0A2I0AMV3_9ASPA|nr:hypothetical protein AXF42_Ash002200 [Apostasia shenzhenica]
MAGTQGESIDQQELETEPRLKRKPDNAVERKDETLKKQHKSDAPLEVGLLDEGAVNGNASKDKGKTVLSASDKGKGKMVMLEDEDGVDEEDGGEFDDSDGSSSEDDSDSLPEGDGGDEDSDFSDDPLAEVDPDNILPSRTRRRRTAEPGAYLVEDGDDDDDEEDGESE